MILALFYTQKSLRMNCLRMLSSLLCLMRSRGVWIKACQGVEVNQGTWGQKSEARETSTFQLTAALTHRNTHTDILPLKWHKTALFLLNSVLMQEYFYNPKQNQSKKYYRKCRISRIRYDFITIISPGCLCEGWINIEWIELIFNDMVWSIVCTSKNSAYGVLTTKRAKKNIFW